LRLGLAGRPPAAAIGPQRLPGDVAGANRARSAAPLNEAGFDWRVLPPLIMCRRDAATTYPARDAPVDDRGGG